MSKYRKMFESVVGMITEPKIALDEAKGNLTYEPKHSGWFVMPKSKNEFGKHFPLHKEDEAKEHAAKISGDLIKVDQHRRAMKE